MPTLLAVCANRVYRRWPLPRTGRGVNGKRHTLMGLQVGDYSEEVARAWIALVAQHADQALRALVQLCPQRFEADGRVHVIAQKQLPGFQIIVQERIECLFEECGKNLQYLDI